MLILHGKLLEWQWMQEGILVELKVFLLKFFEGWDSHWERLGRQLLLVLLGLKLN